MIEYTEEQKITDWFIHEFWPVYPSKWCRNGKGSRQKALNSMLKQKPNDEERKRILGNLKAQIRADKGNPNRCFWSIGLTYVNNQMWEDTIETQEELPSEELKKCSQCDNRVIGPQYNVCEKHTESHQDRLNMMKILKDLGLAYPGQSLQQLSQSCREYLQTSGAFGKALKGTISSEKPQEPGNR